MRRDLVVSATSGYTPSQLRYWLNSLERTGFSGECVVFVGNHDRALVDDLYARGCHVVHRAELIDPPNATLPAAFNDRDICVDRYFLLWKFLRSMSTDDLRFVISVDMRDAVFQLNPATWLEQHLASLDFVVASEGLAYAHEPWNRDSMLEAFGPSVFAFMQDRLVWNCGTIAGRFAAVRDLSLNLYECSRTVTYADQAALNMLLALSPFRDRTLFDEGDLGWACQAATMCKEARGRDLSYCYRGLEPLFDGETVYTATGTPFCIVHQYDRIPYWKHSIEKRFG